MVAQMLWGVSEEVAFLLGNRVIPLMKPNLLQIWTISHTCLRWRAVVESELPGFVWSAAVEHSLSHPLHPLKTCTPGPGFASMVRRLANLELSLQQARVSTGIQLCHDNVQTCRGSHASVFSHGGSCLVKLSDGRMTLYELGSAHPAGLQFAPLWQQWRPCVPEAWVNAAPTVQLHFSPDDQWVSVFVRIPEGAMGESFPTRFADKDGKRPMMKACLDKICTVHVPTGRTVTVCATLYPRDDHRLQLPAFSPNSRILAVPQVFSAGNVMKIALLTFDGCIWQHVKLMQNTEMGSGCVSFSSTGTHIGIASPDCIGFHELGRHVDGQALWEYVVHNGYAGCQNLNPGDFVSIRNSPAAEDEQ